MVTCLSGTDHAFIILIDNLFLPENFNLCTNKFRMYCTLSEWVRIMGPKKRKTPCPGPANTLMAFGITNLKRAKMNRSKNLHEGT